MARSSTTFTSGNQAGKKHGARSPRAVRRRATRTRRLLKLAFPEMPAHQRPLLELLADVVAQRSLMQDWLDDRGGLIRSAKGDTWPCADAFLTLTRFQATLIGRLQPGSRPGADLLDELMGGKS